MSDAGVGYLWSSSTGAPLRLLAAHNIGVPWMEVVSPAPGGSQLSVVTSVAGSTGVEGTQGAIWVGFEGLGGDRLYLDEYHGATPLVGFAHCLRWNGWLVVPPFSTLVFGIICSDATNLSLWAGGIRSHAYGDSAIA